MQDMATFTDGSWKTCKSLIAWSYSGVEAWQSDIAVVEGSPHVVEIIAVISVSEIQLAF